MAHAATATLDKAGRLWPLGSARPSGDNPLGLVAVLRNATRREAELPPTFCTCSFGKQGEELVAVDEHGDLVAVRAHSGAIARGRRLGARAHALCFAKNLPREVLVALADKSVLCLDVDSPPVEELGLRRLEGHRHVVHTVAYHPTRNIALTASVDKLTLWDSTNWRSIKSLGGGSGIVHAMFTPRGDLLLVAFRNEDVLGWGLSSFDLLVCLTPWLPPDEPRRGAACNLTNICMSPDSRYVVGAGKGRFLFVWDLRAQSLLRVIELPDSVSSTLQVEFLPDNAAAAVLGDDGVIRFVQVLGGGSSRVLSEIASDDGAFLHFALAPTEPQLLAGCLSNGSLTLHDLAAAKEHRARLDKFRRKMGLPVDDVQDRFLRTFTPGSAGGEAAKPGAPAPEQNDPVLEGPPPANSDATAPTTEPQVSAEPHAPTETPPPLPCRPPPPRPQDAEFQPTASQRAALGGPQPQASPAYPGPLAGDTPPLVKLAKELRKEHVQLDEARLQRMLAYFGEFPEKYRALVWRFLLQLPENCDAYSDLIRKGPNAAFASLYEAFPVRSERVFARFQRVLFALAHWCPLFEEISYLPAMTFPFVKAFGADELAAFETIMMVLFRLCEDWFESFPHLPVLVLARVDKLLGTADPGLLGYFAERGWSSEQYAWPLLRSLFSEVLSKNEWLKLWDHVLANMDKRPHLLEAMCVAYLRYFRNTIQSLRREEELAKFMRRQNPLDIRRLLKAGLRLHKQHSDVWAGASESALRVLPRGTAYPAFRRYPTFVVDYEAQERQRIKFEEDALLRKKEDAEALREKVATLERREREQLRMQEDMLRLEEENRKRHAELESARLAELQRVEKVSRMRRAEQVAKMEALARENITMQQRMRQAEMQRQEMELAHRAKLLDLELEARKEEEQLASVESQAAAKLQSLHAQRELEQEMQAVRLHSSKLGKQAELEWKTKQEAWRLEDEKRKVEQALRVEQAARESRVREIALARAEVDAKFTTQQTETLVKLSEIERERQLRAFSDEVAGSSHTTLEKRLELERLVAAEEKRQREALLREHEAWTKEITAERERLLAAERHKLLEEARTRDERIANLQRIQARRAAEAEAAKALRSTREKLDEEERQLERQLLALDEQRRTDQQAEAAILRKEQEVRDRLEQMRQAREAERDAMLAERRRFQDLRLELDSMRSAAADSGPAGALGSPQGRRPGSPTLSKHEQDLIARAERARERARGIEAAALAAE